MFAKILKRDGREVQFDESKITEAIFKAARAVGGADKQIEGIQRARDARVVRDNEHAKAIREQLMEHVKKSGISQEILDKTRRLLSIF